MIKMAIMLIKRRMMKNMILSVYDFLHIGSTLYQNVPEYPPALLGG